MKFGLSEKTLTMLLDFFVQFPEVEQVKVYGSRAKGNFKRGSDIDLAFYAHTESPLEGKLRVELEELPIPYLFDITDYYRLDHADLKDHIDRVGQVLFEKEKSKWALLVDEIK